jgi:hypothetical protein
METPPGLKQWLHHLKHNEALKHQPISAGQLDARVALLRAWQSERLAHTYADLMTDKQYRPACLFFLSDIYAPRDFSQRDHDAERIHAFLSRMLPAPMIRLLTDVIELNRLTAALDERLAQVLVDSLGVVNAITPEVYAAGYRACDNRAERVRQIDLITKIVAELGQGARHNSVGVALRIGRGPARRAGWEELAGFLERGYAAFKQMRDVPTFVAAIDVRERLILERIFAGHADPFGA